MCDPLTLTIAAGATALGTAGTAAAVAGTAGVGLLGYSAYQQRQGQKDALKEAKKSKAEEKAALDLERKKADKTKQSNLIKSVALHKQKAASLLTGGRRDTMVTKATTLGSTGVQGKTLLGQ